MVEGGGIFLSAPDEVETKAIGTQNDYFGLYFSDTFDLTDRLTLTGGGRYNYARIQLTDQSGNAPDLNGVNQYVRFNPAGGATYKLNPNVSLYGGYSEANRAPIAAELACSDPENPCLIESFLVADPHLDQVVSHTWEAGVQGREDAGGEPARMECRPVPYREHRRHHHHLLADRRSWRVREWRDDAASGRGSEHRLPDATLVHVRQLRLHTRHL